ncbi:MAG: hypothetical protein RLZZ333_2092 [Bacteroidota bacterium]
MQKLGFNISDKPTSFQDLSLNIHLPTKKIGSFSVFGFGGLSKQYDELARDSITWINNPSTRSSSLDAANAGAMGVSHQINLGKKILWRSVLSKNGYLYREEDSRLEKFNGPVVFTRINKFSEWNTQFSSVLTFKASKHHLFKLGAYTKDIAFNLQQREAVSNVLRDKIKNNGSTWLTNYFVQWKWDASNKFSFQLGGHGQQLGFNKSSAFQPRFGLRYQTGNGQFLSFGYGMHSQIQPLGNYFARPSATQIYSMTPN